MSIHKYFTTLRVDTFGIYKGNMKLMHALFKEGFYLC